MLRKRSKAHGEGKEPRFTRPHAMAHRPGTEDVLVTDIDNRALRLVSPHGHVSTVSYDDGGLFNRLWRSERASGGGTFSRRPSSFERAAWTDVQQQPTNKYGMVTADKARADCENRGLGLCSPASLRRRSHNATAVVWTNLKCHSCWLLNPGICPKKSQTDHVSSLKGSHWGAGIQMLAFIRGGGADHFEMRMECTFAGKAVPAANVCCPPAVAPS